MLIFLKNQVVIQIKVQKKTVKKFRYHNFIKTVDMFKFVSLQAYTCIYMCKDGNVLYAKVSEIVKSYFK